MVFFSLLLFQVIFKLGHFSVYFILLVGVILGTFFRSITSFLQLIMNPESFLAVQNVMFASFEASNSKLVTVSGILLVILIIVTIILRPYLDVLLLGRAQAINLGVSYENMTRMFLILVALLVSISTALIGPVTFLGLLTVNLAHEFMKTYEHKFILPATILFSWISLFIAQWVVENLFEATTEFSLIVDLVGGSYFIYLLVKKEKCKLIQIRNLDKTIDNKPILKDISVDIKKGKLTSLIGPNGAGKSTLLSAISRLFSYENGSILIEDKEISEYKTDDLAKKIKYFKTI